MEFRQLVYIIVIAEEQNLTKAAARLFVSQSTLSLFLSKLESTLGVSLFERSKNRLAITPSGQLYVDAAKKILEIKNELYDRLHVNKEESTINLGLSCQMMFELFGEVYSRFQALYPYVHVSVMEGRSYLVLDLLDKNEVDIAIYGSNELNKDDQYITELIKKDELTLILPPDHPNAWAASTDYDNPPVADMTLFANDRFALANKKACEYHLALDLFRDYGINPQIICNMSNSSYLCQMVLNNSCLSLFPGYSVPRDKGVLVCRPSRPYYRYVQFVQKKNRKLPMEAAVLKSMLLEAYYNYHQKKRAPDAD